MRIILNNREEHIDSNKVTISELLMIKNFTFKLLVIKVNGNLIRKPDYPNTTINEGDDVAIIHLLSGG